MIELLIASVVALFAASAAAQIINNLTQSGLNRRAAASSSIEVAITNDLAWFRQYSALWRMLKGPYTYLSTGITQTDYYQKVADPSDPSQYLTYPPNECSAATPTAMATAFQQNASNPATYVSPLNPPDNPIPADATLQRMSLPSRASEYSLYRKVEPGTNSGTLTITYILQRSGSTLFVRPSTLYLPAAGWCS